MASRLVVKIGTTTISAPFAVSFSDTLNQLGHGTFSLTSDDSQASGINLGDVVTIQMDGLTVFHFVIETIHKVDVDGGEAAGKVYTFSGRSSIALLERYATYPPGGLITSSTGQTSGSKVALSPWADQRLLGWPDPALAARLDGSPATADNVTLCTGTNRPVGWPDVLAYFTGSAAGATEVYGAGYFGNGYPFNTSNGKAAVFFAATGEAELYMDGVLILSISAAEADPTKTYRIIVEATTGYPHLLCCRVRTTTGTNALWACSVHSFDASTKFLMRTNSPINDWFVLANPATQPGISAGEIIIQLLGEATSRGISHGWTTTFTTTQDSAGANWPIIPIFPLNIGNTLVEVLDQLSAWVDWGIEIGDGPRVLSMWNAEGLALPGGGTGAGRGTTSGVTVAVGTNALEVVHEVTA
jgi:hypothetical protein